MQSDSRTLLITEPLQLVKRRRGIRVGAIDLSDKPQPSTEHRKYDQRPVCGREAGVSRTAIEVVIALDVAEKKGFAFERTLELGPDLITDRAVAPVGAHESSRR